MWLYSDVEDYVFYAGETNWNPIPGATNASYTINYELCQSRWFLRCSRRSGCNDWPGESNVVRVRINPVPVVGINVDANCVKLYACAASVTANVTSGGTAPFSYVWNTGATTQSITGICNAGVFSVTVTD
ncbi:MAG: hypothetical protein EBU82_14015, partial [Flavobacteriia bacterium]|nr:hypothetical protein [Flavobacteriia bacterium]